MGFVSIRGGHRGEPGGQPPPFSLQKFIPKYSGMSKHILWADGRTTSMGLTIKLSEGLTDVLSHKGVSMPLGYFNGLQELLTAV